MVTNSKKKNRYNLNRGFTLIEMLIAVLIFTLSLSSLMSVSSSSLKGMNYSKQYLIGSYLTLEAVEIVHNLRDQALLNRSITNVGWRSVFGDNNDIFDNDGCFDGNGKCNFYIDGGEPKLGKCSTCDIYFDKSIGYYFQTRDDSIPIGAEKTPFSRNIQIKTIDGNDEGEIYVLVETMWPGGGVSYGKNLYLYQ